MRTDIMLDIETLGTKEGSTIFQIAAVGFDITTGQIKDSINLIGDISKFPELSVDGSTLKWWLDTDKELLSELLNAGTLTENELLSRLLVWLLSQSQTGDMKDVYLWGNGILFDNAKIQHALNEEGLRYPIIYKNDRDVRTILELASLKSGIPENDIRNSIVVESETLHDAFDDVKRQIRLVRKCYEILIGEAE